MKFTDQDDKNLAEFLAEQGRYTDDPYAVKTYNDLGPGVLHLFFTLRPRRADLCKSEYVWSRTHKPDAWARRAATIDDLDGKVMRLVRERDAQPQKSSKKPISTRNRRKADVQPIKVKVKKPAQTKLVQIKPAQTKSKEKNRSAEYDLEGEIANIAEGSGLPSRLVLELVQSTGSVVVADRLIDKLVSAVNLRRASSSDNEGSEGSEGSDSDEESCQEEEEEEEEEQVVIKKELLKKVAFKSHHSSKRKWDDDEDSYVVEGQKPAKKKHKNDKASGSLFQCKSKHDKKLSSASGSGSAYHLGVTPIIKPDPDAGTLQRGASKTRRRAAVVAAAIPADTFYARLRPRAYRGGPTFRC
ncbi:hypothetical protein MVEN_02387100 [Mycena venus]|uniref:Uncharacterized protein n=1 Tax=Mycena venus TaxID=2733690 RepID=A0A8H6X1S1_9AGAR|nr:hypothetical protein MVEN_02387100 [Mycena venus]